MTAYTPGPWEMIVDSRACFHEGNRVAIVSRWKDGRETGVSTVAEVWPTDDRSDLADARLIAQAPAMAAILRELVREVDDTGSHQGCAPDCYYSEARAILKAIDG